MEEENSHHLHVRYDHISKIHSRSRGVIIEEDWAGNRMDR
jgi:hypothetical protein